MLREMNRQPTKLLMRRNKYMKWFRKLRISYARLLIRGSFHGLHAVRIRLHWSPVSEIEKCCLTDCISSLLLAGFQVQVLPTQKQSKVGQMVTVSYLYEGKLIFRRELNLRQVAAFSILTVCRTASLSIRLVCGTNHIHLYPFSLN